MIFVVFASICLSLQYGVNRVYGKRVKPSSMICYVFFISATVLLFYTAYSGFRLSFNLETVIYGLLFGLSYCMCFMFQLKAINAGNVALTSLILSYSLIIPAIVSLVIYGSMPSVWFYIGLGLLAVSLLLIGLKIKNGEGRPSKKWWLYSIAALLLNGSCSVIQMHHQTLNSGNYKNEFMICGMAIVLLISGVAVLISLKSRKEVIKVNFKKGWWVGVLTGIFNALVNLFAMLAVVNVSPDLAYTVICGGSIILTYIISITAFKEKLYKMQFAGFVLGVLSIVLLNL